MLCDLLYSTFDESIKLKYDEEMTILETFDNYIT